MPIVENIKTDSDGNIVTEAKRTKRLINFLVDTAIWFLLIYFLGYLAREFESLEYIFSGLMWLLIFGAYSIISEFFFRKTIGKYFTKTRVVFKNGVEPTFRLIVVRTWARAIPFEFLSLVLGNDAEAWHDVLSKTMVVDENEK
jgi:uncharacterized RDD family membrane protein YckC